MSVPRTARSPLARGALGVAVVTVLFVAGAKHLSAESLGMGRLVAELPRSVETPAIAVDPIQTMRSTTGGSLAAEDKVRVVARSFELAAIGAEINARIEFLPAREGDRFHKGDVLVRFDCAKIAAEHEAAVAAYRAHRSSYENQRQMLHYKATGTLAVEQAQFEMEKAQADMRGFEAKKAGCVVYAPFDGRVAEKVAQVHEIAQPNQPIIRIVNESKLELVLMVPSAWLSRIKQDARFTVRFDETGETHAARIIQSTGLIDPVSQSARFIAELVTPSTSVIPGMSGTAQFIMAEASK